MANVLLPAHLSCYTHPFTLSLSEFLKILSFFLFFFLWEKSITGNTIYLINLMAPFNAELVCCQKWILAMFFLCLPPTFPTRSSITFRTVASRCWSTTDSSVVAFRALESFLTASFSSSPVLTSPYQMGTLCLHRARQSGTKSFLPCS